MKLLGCALLLAWATTSCSAASQKQSDDSLSSQQILPASFKPPQVFKNTNVMRNINLDKSYVKETVNLVVENVDKRPQSEYYVPFDGTTIGRVGGFTVRDKKDATKPAFRSEVVEYDSNSGTQFYRVTFLEPLAPKEQLTLVITYHILNVLKPLPATIGQNDKQYLSYEFSEYAHSAYDVNKQKTKIKFPGVDIPDWTGKPEKQGSSFTYGAFDNVPAGAESMQSVRYEFTKPLIYTSHLERDIEISQWGGNAAFEDRYWLTNKGAELSNQFSRVAWAGQQYYNAPTSAIKEFRVPLKAGAVDAYFTDEVGNISTSHFRSSKKESLLELKPRYPVFGGWNFPFKIGYNAPLSNFLRLVKGESYILKVPFLEGPKQIEGVAYERVTLRVILPEGAINVKYQTELPLVDAAYSSHKTFFDTLGRTTLTLTAMNVVDESREVPLVITYDYPFSASFRKPITLFMGVLAVFAASWLVTSVDTSIGKKA